MSVPSPTPMEDTPNKEIEFVPNYDQERDFDFDLLWRKPTDTCYSTESLTKYFYQHFFVYRGMVYKWAGERVDKHHPFFKRPQTMAEVTKWFEKSVRLHSWISQVKISGMPEQDKLTREIAIDIPEGITEFPNIAPILEFDKHMCGYDDEQMLLFHQFLGMKLKYPDDMKRLADKFVCFAGMQGDGKTSVITSKLNDIFQCHPYEAPMREYGNKSIYNFATARNIVVDDAFSGKTTVAQTNTVKEMTSKPVVGGVIKNRSTTWFFVNYDNIDKIPMRGERRSFILRTSSEYNQQWDKLKEVQDLTTKYRDEYVAYLLSTIDGYEHMGDLFSDYEKEEVKTGEVDVDIDPSDSFDKRVQNYFKKDMLENPSKYTSFPMKLPLAKEVVAGVQDLYGSGHKEGMTSCVTKLYKAIVPRLRNNNKQRRYVMDNIMQLKSMAAGCHIGGGIFDQVFIAQRILTEFGVEPTEDPEPDDPEPDMQEELELLEWQHAKQEEIKQDRVKELEAELELMKEQMRLGMQMMMQMHKVAQPVIIPQPKALPPPDSPKPKQKAKLKVKLTKK